MENSTFAGLKHPTHGYAVKQIELEDAEGVKHFVNPAAFGGYTPETKLAIFGYMVYELSDRCAAKFEKLLKEQNGVLDLSEGDNT